MALESEPTIPIIISVCALMISILGYADNRKKMDILMRKENKKKVVEEAIEILRNINYTLKDLSHPFNFTNIDQMIVGIIQEVCGKDKIKLSIRYESLKLNDDVIFTNSLKDPTEFTNKIRNILFSFSREGKRNRYFQYIGSNIESSIDFTTQPNFICIKSLGLGNLFTNLVKLENDLSNLVRVEFLIEPFDPELFQLLNENYECILNLLYEALNKQVHDVEITKNMTPQEIKEITYNTVNYNQIIEKTTFMSENLGKRVNELKKELAVQYLTS